MEELNKEEMLNIKAGGISASLISAVFKGVLSVTDIGRYLGSSLRRIFEHNLCGY